jgi:dihydropteroate synthase
MTLLLDAANALSLDENLIGNAWHAQHTPRSPIVSGLLEEERLAGGDYLFILYGSFCHSVAVQNKAFYTNKTLNVRGRLIDLSTPRVMGILNLTPDSFFDGGKFKTEKSVLAQVEKMLNEGATMIDIGGASSRPGAAVVKTEDEAGRVLPAVRAIGQKFPDAIISIDTIHSTIAKEALNEGASMINDISAGEHDNKMIELIAEWEIPYVVMHMRGTPQTMNTLTHYDNLLKEIADFFHDKIVRLRRLGIKDIIADPGFGFAKTVDQNFQLLQQLDYLNILGVPLMVGLSRKSMVWRTLETTPDEALNGTTVLNTTALLKGASILRVHDVKEAIECIKLTTKITQQQFV